MTESGICVRCAMSDDAEGLSAFAAAIFPLGGPPGADPLDLAHYIATELTAECFRAATSSAAPSPGTILLVGGSPGRLLAVVSLSQPR